MTTPASNDDSLSRLAALRSRLDAVDTGLHRLLRERFEIVEEIGKAKGPDESVIRPAREAAVIENRLALHKGALPTEMLAHFWRTLISAACQVQRGFAIHTADALDVALFLYGPVSVLSHATGSAAVSALGAGDVAVVPLEGDWWRPLAASTAAADSETAPAHVIGRCRTSAGGTVLIVGGSNVSPGTGPEAAVMRDGTPHIIPAGDIGADDTVLGRFHPFPIEIPVARTSAS
ncbi:chorismate mutase [Acuticoccus sp. MNP-M23]|uniref:chorismate mutase n=1 Tax=Acuticoccus sp. MNP-M23 TaxID=3072793 RepID=UPI00281516A0|nr:chorismate mutase [Acuticoccus sp. MNP-M23]WMS42881.1 chorismate mutase [Acuticoccus sp. MNP-M23]